MSRDILRWFVTPYETTPLRIIVGGVGIVTLPVLVLHVLMEAL